MIRRQRAGIPEEESSSSDEEDAFAALSRKTPKKSSGTKKETASSSSTSFNNSNHAISINDNSTVKEDPQVSPTPKAQPTPKLPVANTSSTKRHHHITTSRKAKMDALLQELEAEKKSVGKYGPSSRDRFAPTKKGSYCESTEEEQLTTNVFVGNLDPSITEEEVAEMFRQFGDLYSVKIMWPRTPEERARNRNTGFVCFMKREDATDAMDAFNEADPFRVGRRLMLRWGKNVKKVIRRGTGGVIPAIRKKPRSTETDLESKSKRQKVNDDSGVPDSSAEIVQSKVPRYDPTIHAGDAIQVVAPTDPKRLKMITTVASFIAKDGSIFEKVLLERESNNPKYSFLTFEMSNESEVLRNEHIFYRWRVFAFCQGDGFGSWRTEPFVMFQPNGRFWIPPSLDREAAQQEEQAALVKEEEIRQRKQERRLINERKDFLTGRQLEQAKFGRTMGGSADVGTKLNEHDLQKFNTLVKKKLCASRSAICEAMAFCFDKSASARQISTLLKDLLLESSNTVSVDTRIARIFLLSDILYNSQQPGVRNAFLYRDAIEAMAPDVFTSLGKHGNGTLGRMTMNKLSNAVSAVLCAWTNWSVYNPTFLDELHARFQGKEITKEVEVEEKTAEDTEASDIPQEENPTPEKETGVVERPRGDWKDVDDEDEHEDAIASTDENVLAADKETKTTEDNGSEPVEYSDIDGEELNESDLDGEPLDEEDVDGEPIGDDELDYRG